MTDKAIEALALVKLRLSEIDGTYDWSAEIATIRAALEAKVKPVAWRTEDFDTDKSATTYDPVVADRWRKKGWPVESLYEAPPTTAEVKAQALEGAGRD